MRSRRATRLLQRRARQVRPVSFDGLVEGVDHLVVQAPLTPQTHHTFDRATLRRMKPTALLVNTARGPIVADTALYEALTEGRIAGAAVDDIEEEPAKQRDWQPDNPLFELPNVSSSPTPPTTPRKPSARSAPSPRKRPYGS
ncbi:NAD(P)-dependent oxidoreductase [Streptomyces sp. enrichment culture]|uniref:NAD(P)-dependent oxidoreductase n=1 Tax=Streptomyces sp. enrichment culture TaxID=1795815 RepID=UPI003F557EBF